MLRHIYHLLLVTGPGLARPGPGLAAGGDKQEDGQDWTEHLVEEEGGGYSDAADWLDKEIITDL